MILGEEVDEGVVAEPDVAGGGLFLPAEEADEGGFAGAIGPDEGDAVASVDGEADVFEDGLHGAIGAGVDLGEVYGLDDGATAGRGLRDLEVDRGLFFGYLNALDLFELLDAGLDLLGLGGLVAEPVDEGFEVVDAVALVFVGAEELSAALFLFSDVLLIVAVVEVGALVPELDGFVDRDVEEVAIVRDEDEAVGVVIEVFLEPVAGFEVEVVGGLIQEQKRRLLQEQFGERDAHLPATGELFGRPLPVFLGEAEAAEDGADLVVERVDVVGVHEVGDVRVALGGGGVLGALVVVLGELGGEIFGLLFEAAELVEDGEALLEDGFAAHGEAVLREVAEGHVFLPADGAVVEGL